MIIETHSAAFSLARRTLGRYAARCGAALIAFGA